MDCLDNIVQVVNKFANCNVAQLVGIQQGDVLVPVYDWTAFLDAHFRHLKGFKKYHHFHVSREHPDKVFLKEFEDSVEKEVEILIDNWQPLCIDLPSQMHPFGLSNNRQWYLYEKI